MSQKQHICVCICTYKRPELLRRLLSKLEEQETEVLFDYSIVIVDNDRSESARQTAESFSRQSKISISYYVEPEQNIALARNKALQNSIGNFCAFIDDDEFPSDRWLLILYKAMIELKCDGILGPVLPFFETEPPKWVLKGRFFDRPTHPTGHVLRWENTRTGNVLLRKKILREGIKWFDPTYGRGGEDRDFFRRMIEDGHVFVWCNEAYVFETVPPERWKTSILLKRALIRGKMALNAADFKSTSVVVSAIAIILYTAGLPLFFLFGNHLFMEYFVKIFDHLGKVLAFFGIDCVKEKYVGG